MKFAMLIFNHCRNHTLHKPANLIRHLQTHNFQVKTFLPVTTTSYQLRQTCHYHVQPWPHTCIERWMHFHNLKTSFHSHSLPCHNFINGRSLHTSSVFLKSKKKKQDAVSDEETDDEDYDLTDDSDVSGEELSDDDDDDNQGKPKDYKDVHHNLTSLRIDAVLSKGLNVSRKKVEDSFFNTSLRLNGKVLTKKGKKVSKGDTIDIIKGPAPPSKEDEENEERISLMRVVVKEVLPDKTSKDRVRVVLRRWKSLKLPKSQVIT